MARCVGAERASADFLPQVELSRSRRAHVSVGLGPTKGYPNAALGIDRLLQAGAVAAQRSKNYEESLHDHSLRRRIHKPKHYRSRSGTGAPVSNHLEMDGKKVETRLTLRIKHD